MKRIIALILILAFATPAHAECARFLRKYNEDTTIDINVWLPDGSAFYTGADFVAGDILFSQSEAAQTNCTEGTGACVTDEGSFQSIAIDAAELDTKRLNITMSDVSGDVWLDKCAVVETFGDANAQFPTADVNVTSVTDGALVNADLAADFLSAAKVNGDVSTEFATTLLATTTTELASMPSAATPTIGQQLRWLYQYGLGIYKITSTSTTQTLKKDDGTTSLGTCAISDDGTTFSKNECN